MSKYRGILRNNLGGVLGVSLLNIVSSFAMVFAGYSLAFLFTAYEYEGNRVRALTITFVIVLAIWLAAMGIYSLALLARAKLQRKLKTDIRSMIGTKISSMDYREFVDRDCGHYVSWLTNDVEQIYSQSFSSLFSGVENLATTVFSLGALCLLSWRIGLAAIILLTVISVLPQLTSGQLKNANAARSEAMEVSTEGYKDIVMGGSIFFLANLRGRIGERITRVSQTAELADYRYNRTNVAVQMLISTVSLIGQVILLLVTLMAAILGAAPAGAALSVGNLAGSFFNGAGELVQSFMTVRSSRPLWEKFEEGKVIEVETEAPEADPEVPGTESEIREAESKVPEAETEGPGVKSEVSGEETEVPEAEAEGKKKRLSVIPEITLRNVSFAYGDRAVLDSENFVFRAGGKYAVMGESGSGKSTLMKIILGLLPGYTGEVRYGGIEQRETALESLHDQMAFVDQQVYLFQDTVRFNITLGEPYSDGEIRAAVKRCRLEDYVNSLPEGLDTVISENGKNLSGGQRQRIALARGLIRKVQYIILDEGTSALDEENALDIERNLMENKDLCVVVITHHLRREIRERLDAVYRLGEREVPAERKSCVGQERKLVVL